LANSTLAGHVELLALTYMEYDGDLVRHWLRNDWYEVGTKFDDCGTDFDDLGTKDNPGVIKYMP